MRARLAKTAFAIALLLAGACESPPWPATGALRVSVATTGGDVDLDGYAVRVEGVERASVGVNGAAVIPDLATGTHTVELTGIDANCAVSGENPRAVTVFGDTSGAAFAVICTATGVRVSTATGGIDFDGDGYSVSLDGGEPMGVGATGTIDFTRLSPGTHVVTLAGIATNCAVTDNPRTITVTTGHIAPVAFAVTCSAVRAVIEVRAATTGLDLDPNGYTIQLDSGAAQGLPINGIFRFTAVSGGDHTVTLAGVAANCTVAGDNPRTVSATTGGAKRDTARTTYDVTCTAFAGIVEVTTATSGVDVDQNGYITRLDGESGIPVAVNGTVRFGATAGAHQVMLEDVAPNCTVAGDNPRTLSVTVGGSTRDTVRTTYVVACASHLGTARVVTATTGADIDPDGYLMNVDCDDYYGYCYSEPMSANDTVVISDVPTGSHTFQLQYVAPNCTVSGDDPRTVQVAGGTTTDVVFSVACVALARIDVTTTTTGLDFDANGYAVFADGSQTDGSLTAVANGTASLGGLLAGAYTVTLSGLSLNCALTSPGAVSVAVPDGGTASVSFSVDCAAAGELAYSNGDIYAMKTNGAGVTQLTTDAAYESGPAWSPDGSQIAFTSTRDGNAEIYVMDATGANQTRLTTNTVDDYRPAWSPLAAKIAFVSHRDGNDEIYVMDSDGSNPVNLTSNPAGDYDPAWSPDGTKIAFGSARGGIYVMNANGSGLTQLTTDATDSHPTWSPDGTKLAFSRIGSCGGYYSYYCERDLFVVNSNGTGLTPLRLGWEDEGDPSWSPDGAWIAFNAAPCDYYYGCSDWTLQAVRSNGTDERIIALPQAFNPAWKP